ncbi:MAG TPA: protein kinase [Acidobacteriota bacterium]|nr:protein kinase [Acidobacteriota bacterium]
MADSDNDRTQSFVALTKGTKVLHYRIVEKIGAGGMGEVYLAEDTDLERNVALKFMPAHAASNADMRARFTREARAVAALNHPNIVTIHEVGEFNGRPFFAMEHVPGEALRTVIKQGRLSTNEAIRLAMQICEGLHEAHSAGVVHRDIKPANIIIDTKDRARILDFGLAMVSGEDRLTKTGSTLGTVGYMSPEQIVGRNVDHRSDLFSVGVILYEMLTGRRPFEGDNDAAVVKAIADSTPEPIARFKSGVTGELQQIVDRALEKNLETRYQTASGMLADLRRLVSSESVAIPKKKVPRLAWLAGIAVLIIVVWGSLQLTSWLSPSAVAAKSIAVVDFDNVGAAEDAYLASGLAEDLSIKLRQLEGVQVASSADIRRLAKENLLPREIASRLKVQYALGGSLLRQDSLVRINVELIDRESGKVVWSDQINKQFTEIFQFMDEVSLRIAQALEIRLTPLEKAAMAVKPTDNTGAYDHYLRGRHYYYNITFRDNELAEREFERALQSDPDYPLALAGLADVFVQRYKERFDYDEYWLDSSEVLIEKALSLQSNLAEAYESRAELYLQEDNITGAIEASERARDLRPDWDEPYVHLGDIYYQQGRLRAAGSMYDTALSFRPSVDAFCGKGNVYQSMGLYDSAFDAFRSAERINPGHDRPYIDLGELEEERHSGESADSLYRLAISVRPDHSTGYVKLSDKLFYRGSIRESEDLLRDFVKRYPYNWEAYEELYYYLVWVEDYAGAMSVIEEAVQRNPNRVWPYLLLARSYAERLSQESSSEGIGDTPEKAILAVERAVALRPNSGRVLESAGSVYTALNRFEDAMRFYDRAMKARPGSNILPASIALSFYRERQYEKAAEFAIEATRRAPGVARYYYFLGQQLGPLNRRQEFLDIMKRAAAEFPDNAAILYYLAQELCIAGSYDEAIAVYRRSLALKESHEILTRLAFAQWLTGDSESALDNFRKARDSWSSAHWIVAILRSEGRHDEIRRYLDSMKVQSPDYKSGLDHWAEVAPSYYQSMRQYDEALAAYALYLESGEATRMAEFITDMAYCYRQKGELDSARFILENLASTAAAIVKPDILMDIAQLEAISRPDLTSALRLAEEAQSGLIPPDMAATERLMLLQYASGQTKEAVKSLGQLTTRGSWTTYWGSIHYRRAQMAAANGLSDSIPYLEDAIRSLTYLARGDYGLGSLAYMGEGILPFRALALARAERRNEAISEIRRSIKLEPENAQVAYCAACLYSVLSDTTQALHWLQTAVERGHLVLWWAKVDPDLDPLRGLPRFKEIMNDWDSRIQAMVARSGKME